MDDNHTLLLDIYHAARTLPADEFPAVVMAMLRAAIGFDFARLLCADTGLVDGLSLYRANDQAHFGPPQQQLVQWLMPHLQEALRVNRQLAAPAEKAVVSGALLIAEANGAIQHCAAQALTLMTSEWPAWHAVRLPKVLLDELRRTGVNRFVGKCIIAHCQRYRTLLLLRLAPRSRVMQLSRRELQVAALYGKGMRAKAVAKALNITPATARNMLQRIYLKLDVHDKAALALLLHQHE